MAGALTTLRWHQVASLLVVVLCWKACISQQEQEAFQSSCYPANLSAATAKCLDQGMQIYSFSDLGIAGDFSSKAVEEHGSIWIYDREGNCSIQTNNFTIVSCSDQHHYLCKRNASKEEVQSKNDTRAIYVPCQRTTTSMSPLTSPTPEPSVTTTNTSTTSHSPRKGLGNTAIYLIVAVCVCVIVVCVVAAVVIKRCTAKKTENVSLKNADVIREKDEGVALTENGGTKDDTRM